MKNIYKTLFFVPFLALTSCGAPKISEEKAEERLAGIAEKQEEEGFEFPTEFHYESVMGEKYEMERAGEKADGLISIKSIVDASVKNQFVHVSMTQEYKEDDEEEADKTEMYYFIKNDAFYYCVVSGETKVKYITPITAETKAEAEAYLGGVFTSFSAVFGAVDFAKELQMLEEIGLFTINGYSYYSTGEGNLTVKASISTDKKAVEEEEGFTFKTFKASASAEVSYDKYLLKGMSILANISYSAEIEGVVIKAGMKLEESVKISDKPSVAYPNLDEFVAAE